MRLSRPLSTPNARRAAACLSCALLMAGGLVGCNRSTPDTTTTTTTTPPMAPASAASR